MYWKQISPTQHAGQGLKNPEIGSMCPGLSLHRTAAPHAAQQTTVEMESCLEKQVYYTAIRFCCSKAALVVVLKAPVLT